MYTMVLMMAASSAGDTPDFFRSKHAAGCTGCTGTVVVAPSGCTGLPAGCTGSILAAPAGCTGTAASCHGGSGFLGLRGRLMGGRGSCHGTPVGGCTGTVVGTGCYGGGCYGSTVGAPVMAGPAGCYPSMGTVVTPGTPVTMPPVTMPEVKKDPMPKKDEPKKDEIKKGNEL